MPQRRYTSLLADSCLGLVDQGRSRLSVTKLDTLIAVALFGEHVDDETRTGQYNRGGDEFVLMKHTGHTDLLAYYSLAHLNHQPTT